ncbi:MAG TPA: DedA family protein [bacterium]|nr:DedA family protein [bacterium]
MITALIDFLAQLVIQIIDALGYGGVFLLMAVESCGILMPSEVIMPFSGFLVALGKMSFWPVVILGGAGNLAGSLLAYYIGYKGGRPLIERYGKYIFLNKHDLDLSEKWFARHGELVVFAGRLLPVVRTYISFPAGVAKMDIKKFSLFTLFGALPWSFLFTWLGVKMGDNWELIKAKLHNFDLAIAVLVVAGVILFIIKQYRKRRARKLFG